LNAEKHLGENQQKLVIPATYLNGGNEKAAVRAAASYDGFGFLNVN
jgi:hypothetical protein